jgi:lyso-ornithine lipid O-acyltransferase
LLLPLAEPGEYSCGVMRPTDELRFLCRSAVALAWTAMALVGFELQSWRGDRRESLRRWQQRYGRVMLRLFGEKLEVVGEAAGRRESYPGRDACGRGRIFVMNHRSMLDIFAALAVAEGSLLSRHDVEGWPLIGLAARRVGTVFVNRQCKQSGSAAVEAMSRAALQGRGLFVFPEGTTFAGDEVRDFRFGAFRAAVNAGAEIVPLGIAYEADGAAYVDESFLSHAHRVSGRARVRAAIAVGAAIPPQTDVEMLRTRAQAAVQELVRQARAALGGPGVAPGGPECRAQLAGERR